MIDKETTIKFWVPKSNIVRVKATVGYYSTEEVQAMQLVLNKLMELL